MSAPLQSGVKAVLISAGERNQHIVVEKNQLLRVGDRFNLFPVHYKAPVASNKLLRQAVRESIKSRIEAYLAVLRVDENLFLAGFKIIYVSVGNELLFPAYLYAEAFPAVARVGIVLPLKGAEQLRKGFENALGAQRLQQK